MKNEYIFEDHNLNRGRMISYSKSEYRDHFPDNKCVFNANIVTKSEGKIWYGDLDITVSFEKLQKIAAALGEPLYVLREMDARFGTESADIKVMLKKAVCKITKDSWEWKD